MNILLFACVALSITFLLLSARSLFKKQWFSSLKNLVISTILIALSTAISSILFVLHSYGTFTYEQPIATISVQKLKSQEYLVTLAQPNSLNTQYFLKGDQWLLSAKILVWNQFGQWLGLHSRYQLYRLQGLYENINQQMQTKPTIYDLSTPSKNWPSWAIIDLSSYLIRTIEGSATYMPLADSAIYQVTLTQTGLISTPINDKAQQAMTEAAF